MHDDKDSPRVAVVNAEFARKIFGSVQNAMVVITGLPDERDTSSGDFGKRKVWEITEDQKPAMFLPGSLQWAQFAWMVVRSKPRSQQSARPLRSTLHQFDAGLSL